MIPIAVDATSVYGVVVLVLAAYMFWAGVFDTGRKHVAWVYRRFRPAPPKRPPVDPAVTLYRLGAQIAYEKGFQDAHRRLGWVAPAYGIRNGESQPIGSVTTGVRRKYDGRRAAFDWREAAVGAGGEASVEGVSIPKELLGGVHESAALTGFVFWVRFRDWRGWWWEAAYDEADKSHAYAFFGNTPPADI